MSRKKYNKLTIIEDTGKRTNSGNAVYKCQCDCGNTCETTLAKLRSGHTKSCGCLIKDTAAKKFKKYIGMHKNRLTLISDTGNRTNAGQRIVLCQCDCGNTCEVVFTKFNNGNTKSCGCLLIEKRKGEHEAERHVKAVKALREKKILSDGTNVATIASNKLRSNNKSGVTGVLFDESRQRWKAQIEFKGKKIYLGRFINKEDAVRARKEAEEKYFKPVIEKNMQIYINNNPDATVKELADHFGISMSMVYYRINKFNLDYKKKSRTKKLNQNHFEKYMKNNPTATNNELAEHFSVTFTTIANHKKILTKSVPKKLDVCILRKYIESNLEDTMDDIAKRFNINKRELQTVIKAHNIDYKRKLASPQKLNVDELRTFIIENPDLTRKEIANDLNVSLATIENYLKKYDLPYKPKAGRRKNTSN
ncbi:IS630 transposase-related protein [Listeria seeligeri]|uniref:IS630 transposase-related protein n=1 Tax=Listeria seeligeri TaxID=1640 RepID=UPI0016249388|nr:IS630 transposase-related protein [Listeria seeligeri]MBC1851202.1 hypothetical protein [Listeria seeligeri]MBC1929314.1 hypothetical protein [Listeria seeligeri]MBF2370296.1 hypothetical protein [Listeria seeligeri]MBF2390496.1 hypothetical protein [Listeria seeligeri]